MPASRAPPVSIPTGLLPECISLDAPVLDPARLYRKPLAISQSGPPHGEDEIGGAVSRPHRSFDGCRQPRISPVAGEKQIFPARDSARPQGVLFRRGLECGTALAHDLPGRQFALYPSGFADIPPDRR